MIVITNLSAGNCAAFAMEALEKDHTNGARPDYAFGWGNGEGLLRFLEEVAAGRGFGGLFSRGIRNAAAGFAPEAAEYFQGGLRKVPGEVKYWVIGESVLWLSAKDHGESVRSLLRELLVLDAGKGPSDDPYLRDRVFARLAQLGDEEATSLFPEAYRRGLTASNGNWRYPWVDSHWRWNDHLGGGVGWLPFLWPRVL